MMRVFILSKLIEKPTTMNIRRWHFFFMLLPFFCIACNNNSDQRTKAKEHCSRSTGHTYAYDADFLTSHTKELVELQNAEGAKVLLSTDYQGRVITSTATGDSGTSYGWINYGLISSGKKKKTFIDE